METTMITNKQIIDEVQKKYNGDNVFKMCSHIREILDIPYDTNNETVAYKMDEGMYVHHKEIQKTIGRYQDGFITKHEMFISTINSILKMDSARNLYGYDFYEQWTFVDSLYNLFKIK